MILKHVNLLISLASKIFTFLVIFYSAVLLAKFVWWVFSPSTSDIYIEKADVNIFENSGKFLVNRSPFGVVLGPPVQEKPAIASQIKLTGLYYNTPKNSIAFYEYNNKSYIAKIGDAIGGTATLKSISASGIVIAENSVDADVNLSRGDYAQAQPIQNNSNDRYSGFPNNQQPTSQSYRQTPYVQTAPNRDNNTQQQNTQNSQTNDFAEKRRKMIEEFQHRNTESSNVSGSNP
ncbi:MAG: hypothetical protein ACK5Z5_04985 [Neisseriaceae bacterium]